MTAKTIKNGFLSNNALKFIAAAFMICDHMGMLLFPEIMILRYIGRLSFPIFAYLIAEGAKYTKNYLRYFLTMSGFAIVIQTGYYIFSHSLEMSVMVTFSLSLIIIFALELFKTTVFTENSSKLKMFFTAILFLGTVVLAAILDHTIDLDYHFSGCILPVFPSLLTTPKVQNPPKIFTKLDAKIPRVISTSVGILLLAIDFGGPQYYGFFAIPLLLLYSEQRGKLKMKYFFYIFYPFHLIILYVISIFINVR